MNNLRSGSSRPTWHLAMLGFAVAVLAMPGLSAVVSATYFDSNNNGQVDTVDVEMDNTVAGSSFEASDWTFSITDVAATAGVAQTPAVNVFRLTLTGMPANDTAPTLTVSYTNGGGGADDLQVGGGAHANFTIAADDGAEPIMVSATAVDTGLLTDPDSIEIEFSEDVTVPALQLDAYNVGASTITGITQLTANTIEIQLDAQITASVSTIRYDAANGDSFDGVGIEQPDNDAVTLVLPPTANRITTADGDSNGFIDQIIIEFNSTVTAANFTGAYSVAGYVIDNGAVEDTRVLLNLEERNIVDTWATPQVTYTAAGDTRREVEVGGETVTARVQPFSETATDAAPPVLINASTRDIDFNGHIDTILVRYSELVTEAGAPYTVAGYRDRGLDLNVRYIERGTDSVYTVGEDDLWIDVDDSKTYSVGDVTIDDLGAVIGDAGTEANWFATIQLVEAQNPDTGVTPQLTYVRDDGGVLDAAGNEVVDGSTDTPIDRAQPVMYALETRDADGNGALDGIYIEFSETVDIQDTGNAGISGITVVDQINGITYDPTPANYDGNATSIVLALNEVFNADTNVYYDTGIVPTITYDGNGNIRDVTNNAATGTNILRSQNVDDTTINDAGPDNTLGTSDDTLRNVTGNADRYDDRAFPVIVSTYHNRTNGPFGALVSDEVIGMIGVDNDDTVMIQFSESMTHERGALTSGTIQTRLPFGGQWRAQTAANGLGNLDTPSGIEWQQTFNNADDTIIIYLTGPSPGLPNTTASTLSVGNTINTHTSFEDAAGNDVPSITVIGDFNPVYWPSGSLAGNTEPWITPTIIDEQHFLLPHSAETRLIQIVITNNSRNLPELHPKFDQSFNFNQLHVNYPFDDPLTPPVDIFPAAEYIAPLSSTHTSGFQIDVEFAAGNPTLMPLDLQGFNTFKYHEAIPLSTVDTFYHPLRFNDATIDPTGPTQTGTFFVELRTHNTVVHGVNFNTWIQEGSVGLRLPSFCFEFPSDASQSTWVHNVYQRGDHILAGVEPADSEPSTPTLVTALGTGNPWTDVHVHSAGGFWNPLTDSIVHETDFGYEVLAGTDLGSLAAMNGVLPAHVDFIAVGTEWDATTDTLLIDDDIPGARQTSYPAYIPGTGAGSNLITVVNQLSDISTGSLLLPNSNNFGVIGLNAASTQGDTLERVVVTFRAARHVWQDDPAGQVGVFEPGIDELFTATGVQLTEGATPGTGVFLWASETHQPDEQAGHLVAEPYRPGIDEAWYDNDGNGRYTPGSDALISQGSTPGIQWASRAPEPLGGISSWASEGNISVEADFEGANVPVTRLAYIDSNGSGKFEVVGDHMFVDQGTLGVFDAADIQTAHGVGAAPALGDDLTVIDYSVRYAFYDENDNGLYDEGIDELYYDISGYGIFNRPNGADDDGDGLIDEADENDVVISRGANQTLDAADGAVVTNIFYTLSTSDFRPLQIGGDEEYFRSGVALFRDDDTTILDNSGLFNDPEGGGADNRMTLGTMDWIDGYAADDGILRVELIPQVDPLIPAVQRPWDDLPVDDAGGNAGNDWFVAIKTSNTISQWDAFTVSVGRYSGIMSGELSAGNETLLKGIHDRAGLSSHSRTSEWISRMMVPNAPGVLSINPEDPTSVEPNGRIALNDVALAPRSKGDTVEEMWAVGNEGGVRYSADGGLTWVEAHDGGGFPVSSVAGTEAPRDLLAVDVAPGRPHTAWVAGTDGYFGNVITDGTGAFFGEVDQSLAVAALWGGDPVPSLNAIQTINSNNVIAVGDDGAIVHFWDPAFPTGYSTDGPGNPAAPVGFNVQFHRQHVGLGLDSDFRDVAFINDVEGWIVGTVGADGKATILHTENGGQSWRRVEGAPAVDYNTISVTNEGDGYIGGAVGTVLQIAAGGEIVEFYVYDTDGFPTPGDDILALYYEPGTAANGSDLPGIEAMLAVNRQGEIFDVILENVVGLGAIGPNPAEAAGSALTGIAASPHDIVFDSPYSSAIEGGAGIMNQAPLSSSDATTPTLMVLPVTAPAVTSSRSSAAQEDDTGQPGVSNGQLDARSYPPEVDTPHAAFGINLIDGYEFGKQFTGTRIYIRSEDGSFDPNRDLMSIAADATSGIAIYSDQDENGFFDARVDSVVALGTQLPAVAGQRMVIQCPSDGGAEQQHAGSGRVVH